MPVRSLADLLAHVLEHNDLGTARFARTVGIGRRRLVELVEGAAPTRRELVELGQVVPLEACAEWQALAG